MFRLYHMLRYFKQIFERKPVWKRPLETASHGWENNNMR
jgi:hypothetical protein